MDWQEFCTLGLVALAAAYVGVTIWKTLWQPGSGSCACSKGCARPSEPLVTIGPLKGPSER